PIGPAPAGENWCGAGESSGDAFRRCRVYIEMLRRRVSFEPPGCRLIIAQASERCPSLTVKVSAKPSAAWEGENYAKNLRDRSPLRWDEPARKALGLSEPDGRSMRERVDPAKLEKLRKQKRPLPPDTKPKTVKRKKASGKPADFHTPRPGSKRKSAAKAAKKSTKRVASSSSTRRVSTRSATRSTGGGKKGGA
ncbi:MAG: hypothetical protein AAF916_11840, partial [Planctomycetota bacterium]